MATLLLQNSEPTNIPNKHEMHLFEYEIKQLNIGIVLLGQDGKIAATSKI